MQVTSNKSVGFTIVELIVTITVGAIMLGTIVYGLGNYYQENVTSAQRTTQDTDTRSVLRAIENELVNTNGFTTDLKVGTPLGSDNGVADWSYKGNDINKPNNRVLIGQTYATDKAPSDNTRLLVFSNPTNCSDSSTSVPVKNAQIYFVARDQRTNIYNLYRRTIVNSENGTMCSAPYQKQTCNPTQAGAYPAVCKGTDALLLENIESFTVDYYTASSDTTPIANQYTTALASDIAAAKSIKITVVTNRIINGVTTQSTAAIRISRPY